MTTYKVTVNTNKIKDRFIVKGENFTYDDLLTQILDEYRNWHFPKIHSFELKGIRPDIDMKNIPNELEAIESKDSIAKKSFSKTLKEMRRLALKKRVIELSQPWCMNWVLDMNPGLQVLLDDDGMVFTNEAVDNTSRCIRTYYPLVDGVFYFEVVVEKLPEDKVQPKGNGYVSIGVVNTSYRDFNRNDFYIGRYSSWGYHNMGKRYTQSDRSSYGDKYAEGDTIGVLLNSNNRSIQYFKNGKSMGIAFTDLSFPVYPAVSTTVQDSRFRLQIPDKEELQNLVHLKDYRDDLILGLNRLNSERENIKMRLSKDFMNKLIEAKSLDGGWIWDQTMTVDKIGIVYPNFKTITNVFEGLQNTIGVRTLDKINDGIHFFEVEIKKSSEYTMVGLVGQNYDNSKPLRRNVHWGYLGSGSKVKNGNRNYYTEPYTTGDRIGIFVDMINQTAEFYKNGIPCGVAFRDIEKNVYFAVGIYTIGEGIEILPSNLDTYFDYISRDIANIDYWDKSKLKGMSVVSDTVIKFNNNNDWYERCLTRKRYSRGRRYFEVTARNVKGKFWLGFTRSIDSYVNGYKFEFDEKVDEVRLGIMIDYDDHRTEAYQNREKVGDRNSDNRYGTCYGAILSEGSDVEGTFEINLDAEKEMTETLFLYN